MPTIISDIIQVTSANDWYIADEVIASQSRDLADLEPIAMFALVSTFDSDYPSLGHTKMTIALTAEHLADQLIGKNISDFPEQLIHRSHF